jgi:hypothetical protein
MELLKFGSINGGHQALLHDARDGAACAAAESEATRTRQLQRYALRISRRQRSIVLSAAQRPFPPPSPHMSWLDEQARRQARAAAPPLRQHTRIFLGIHASRLTFRAGQRARSSRCDIRRGVMRQSPAAAPLRDALCMYEIMSERSFRITVDAEQVSSQ